MKYKTFVSKAINFILKTRSVFGVIHVISYRENIFEF